MPPKKTALATKQSPGRATAAGKSTTNPSKHTAGTAKKGSTQKTAIGSQKVDDRKDYKEEEPKPSQPIKVPIKELDKIVFHDEDGMVAADGRWPFLMDPSGIAVRFLLHRDVNIISAESPKDVDLEAIRIKTLAALRYGKSLIVDLGGADWSLYDVIVSKFNEIQSGLMDSILSKEILKNEKFLELVRPTDNAEQYDKTAIIRDNAPVQNFMLVIVSTKLDPPPALLKQYFPVEMTT